MSTTVNISERQLIAGVFKLSLSLVLFFALIALALTFLADRGKDIALQLLFVCLAFGFASNGVLAVTKIIDWFEARKAKSRG